jgi:60 kDa SS-A/Ro ribonucleoprotein
MLGRSDMAANSAGGFVWTIDKWARLHRFLIIGSDAGTYYIGKQKLTRQSAECVLECAAEDGKRTVDLIVDISVSGRAPKNDPALFALALVMAYGDDKTRSFAFQALPKVARTGTHLFQIVDFINEGGWSRGKRSAVASWYLDKETDKLAYQLVKYRNREGWTHRDVLRQVHPKTDDPVMQDVLAFAAGKMDPTADDLESIIKDYLQAQESTSPERTVTILQRNPNLPREALRTEHLVSPKVQMQMLENGMPMTALVRNLGNLSKSGVLTPMSDAEKIVCDQITNQEHITKSRIHPIQLLTALKTYGAGHGLMGKGTWNVNAKVVDALDAAIYLSFGNVEPANKKTLLALDVSSSMEWGSIKGLNMSAAEASAMMAMVTAATEMQHMIVAFTDGLTVLNFSPRQRLDDILATTRSMNFGSTDCAMPMIAAMQQDWKIETFIVYTDSETWAGMAHPAEALQQYRKHSGIPAKLVVCGMVANNFSIADPNDAGMLDVVGFDTATPNVISDFSRS